MVSVQIPEPGVSKFLFADTRMAWLWLIIRLYVGYAWIMAGLDKVGSPAWTGENAGAVVTGFLNRALGKVEGPHPDVSTWYAALIESVALPNAQTISYLVAYGKVLVGVALIIGILTGIATFFGIMINFIFVSRYRQH